MDFDHTRRQFLGRTASFGFLTVGGHTIRIGGRNDHDNSSRRRLRSTSGQSSGGGAGDDGERMVVGTRQAGTAAAKDCAGTLIRVLDFEDGNQAVVGRFETDDLDSLRTRTDVRYVETDQSVRVPSLPDGVGTDETQPATDASSQQIVPWGVDRIGARAVADAGITGRCVDVALLDTGIDPAHPDLEANVGDGRAFLFDSDPDEWADDAGHGTSVAGIVGAVDNGVGVVGVSPDVTLHAVKVLDASGRGFVSDIADGLRWSATSGFDVANMSFGGPNPSRVLADAIRFAVNRGMNLVASAGNGGPCSACVEYPAANPLVTAVSATTRNDTLATFSSTGPEIDLAGPGVRVTTTRRGGGYRAFSGTSAAAPHVSGSMALLAAAGYVTSERPVRLEESATDLGLPGTAQGHGLVDAEEAVLGLDLELVDETEADGAFVSDFDVSIHADTRLDDADVFSAGEPYFEVRIDGQSVFVSDIVERTPQFETTIDLPAETFAQFERGEMPVTVILWDADLLFDDEIGRETEYVKLAPQADPAETATDPTPQSASN